MDCRFSSLAPGDGIRSDFLRRSGVAFSRGVDLTAQTSRATYTILNIRENVPGAALR